MAGEFAKFFVRLASQFDPKGLKQAEKQIKKTDQKVSQIGSSFKKLGAMFLGGAAIWKMISFARSAFDAYSKQEEAVTLLNQALKNQGVFSKELSTHLQRVASDIQEVTTVGDETTLAMMQMGLSMGIAADQLEDAAKQTIGLSKAYKVDLNSAMKMVALARQGEFTMLNRYIPQLRALTSNTEKAALANRLLAEGFKVAEAEATTLPGQLKQLSNAWGDVKESIAELAVPSLEIIVEALKGATKQVALWVEEYKVYSKIIREESDKVFKVFKSHGKVITEETGAIGKGLQGWADLWSRTMARIAAISKKPLPPIPAPPTLPPGKPPPTEEIELDKQTKDKLLVAEKWYRSEQGRIMIEFYEFKNETELQWDALTTQQKIESMERIKEIYKEGAGSLADSFMLSAQRIRVTWVTVTKALEGLWGGTTKVMSGAIMDVFTDFEEHGFRLKKFLDTIWKGILQSFAQMVSQMIAKWLVAQAVIGAIRLGFLAAAPATAPITAGVPVGHKGGLLEKTGLLFGDKGEFLVPADIVGAIKKGTQPTMMPAIAPAGGPSVTINQTNQIGTAEGETSITEIIDGIREATRSGIAEALDMAKEVYITGEERSEEA